MAKIVYKSPESIKINIDVVGAIGLWDAIKLRIAGKNYKVITDDILKRLRENDDIN